MRAIAVLAAFVLALVEAPAWAGNEGDRGLLFTQAIAAEMARLEVIRGSRPDEQELRGKAVVVSFFASWCVPCRREFLEMRRLIEAVGSDRVKVIAVNWLEDIGHYPAHPMRMQRLIDRADPHISVVVGTEAISRAFGGPEGVRTLPSLYAFDRSGREVYRFVLSSDRARQNSDHRDIASALGYGA
ncbi:MAG: redoxin family protein [Alphaproteobacteria bacterium]